MGKILYQRHTETGEVNYVAGKVTAIREGTGDYAGRVTTLSVVVSVKGEAGMENAYLNIGYFNKEGGTASQQLSDRVKKAKVHVGSFLLLVTGTIKEGERTQDGKRRLSATGFDFTYNGKIEIQAPPASDGTKRVYNAFCGTVRKVYNSEEAVSASVPVSCWNRETKSSADEWYSIRFSDKLLTAAQKKIVVGAPVAVLTTAVTVNTGKNGGTFNNAKALAFECDKPAEK